MATAPRSNPRRTAADFAKMIDALLAWSQQKPHDAKILKPLLAREPAANAINADRVFWLGELLGQVDNMVGEADISESDREALSERIYYLGNEAPIYPQNWKKGDKRAEDLALEVRKRAQVAAIAGQPNDDNRPHDVIARRQRMKRGPDLEENPPWVTKMLADSMVTLQEQVPPKWLPKLEGTSSRGNTIRAELVEYGCGAYGCVMPTLDKDVVLKLTSDPSEAKFAAEIADTLPTEICVHYHTIAKLTGQERKGREVFLLWREAAADVGKIDDLVGMHAEKTIRKQHQAALAAYLAIAAGDVDKFMDLIEVWKKACRAMAKVPELAFVAEGMVRAWDEQGVFISDTHGGNLGRCIRNGELVWVITDPGNVVLSTQHADEHSRFESGPTTVRQKNPSKRRCSVDHDALKADDEAWAKLPLVGVMDGYDDDGNDCILELKNCTTCKSTLARPQKAPTENPTVPKRGAMAFFEEWAGYATGPNETRRFARTRNARELAIAEYVLEEEHPGAEVFWETDPSAASMYNDEDVDQWFTASLVENDTFLASVGAIGDPDRNYRRLIEAELALEAWFDRVDELAQQLHQRRGRPLKINPEYDERIKPEVSARVMRLLVDLAGGWHNQTSSFVPIGDIRRARAQDMFGATPRPTILESKAAQDVYREVDMYLAYFVKAGLIGIDGNFCSLTNKALDYTEKGVSFWPLFREVRTLAITPIMAFSQMLESSELKRYISSFIGGAWEINQIDVPSGPIIGLIEITTAASELAISISVDHINTVPWPFINIRVVANVYPHSMPVPQADNVTNRSFPHSPMELMAMLLPFIDKYHP